MKHTIKLSVSKRPTADAVVSYKTKSMREKVLHFFLGKEHQIMVIIPGKSVESMLIEEVSKKGV